jgi:hypothetical protein
MNAAVGSTLLGLLIVILAVGIPYWLTHKRMRPQHDPAEANAYLEATARSKRDVAKGRPSHRPFWHGGDASRRWQAAHAGEQTEVDEDIPISGR